MQLCNEVTTVSAAGSGAERDNGVIVFGTSKWIAARLGVSIVAVRSVFVVAATAGGLGLILYLAATLWSRRATLPAVAMSPAPDREVGLALITAAVIGAASQWWPGIRPELVVPVALAAVGVTVAWRAADRPSPLGTTGGATTWAPLHHLARVGAGVVAVFGAIFLLAGQRIGLSDLRDSAFAVALALAGIGVVCWPWVRSTITHDRNVRDAAIRDQARAEIADHLHDSVLQTLTLIQRHHDDPQAVGRLARSQERDLRRWLYGGRVSPEDQREGRTWRAAIERLVDDIDESFGVVVETVMVGDAPMAPPLDALVGATREALRNGARHSGCSELSLFSEVTAERITVFVRDRGRGFDPNDVPADRHGIASSIIGRLERVGGTAAVHSGLGDGTEVELGLIRATTDDATRG